jgi:hypothetical protein
MRLLLDESVPARLRGHLPAHEVRTVTEMAWSGTSNGALLGLAADRFDEVVTVDKNLPYQQNLALLPLAVIVLDTRSNELQALVRLVPQLEQTLARLVPRSCVIVASAR